jgi:hypothetical protein
MTHTLKRQFEIQAQPQQLLWLANHPDLAPRYLNFLTAIRHEEPKQTLELEYEKLNWRRFKVWIDYRGALKTHEFVNLRTDLEQGKVSLNHDGPLAQFEAVFHVIGGHVTLTCDYQTKLPFISWLVTTVLDRVLAQVV